MSQASPAVAAAHQLAEAGRSAEAMARLRTALRTNPNDAPAHALLAQLLVQLGQLDPGCEHMRSAIRLVPTEDRLYRLLGEWLARAGRQREAVEVFRAWTAARPGSWWAHNALGVGLLCLEDDAGAADCFARAARLDRRRLEPRVNLAKVLLSMGRAREAATELSEAARLQPTHLPTLSSLAYTLNYVGGIGAQAVREAHAACGRALGQAPVGAAFPGSLDPDRCLRIGFMSPDFRAHSAAYFIAPLLRALDRGTFEPIAYAAFDEFPPDAMTDEFRRLCPQWRDISGLRGEPLDRAIRSDRVDVLVDLAGHTAGHRLETLARRPAPVIASWLGYPCTTGIPGVDLRIVDAITDPAPEADAFATERLARIDGCFVCYGARPDAPAPDLLPPGAPVFGSFNNIAKLDQPVVALWSRLLHEAPGSRLLLKSANLGQHAVREHTEARFAAHGVSADRLELVGGLPALDHLAFYSRMHVALDPFPYSGTTTTCEALWMGVPVVTLAGRSHAGRVGMSLLSAAGMPDLVAGSPREYVRIANELAADQGRLRALRAGLRERLRSSGLCDGPGFARRFGALIREEWRRWCAAGGLGAPKNPP